MRGEGFRASLAVHARCMLGEGATWCARTERFYWTDIEGARLYRYDPSTGERTSWSMPERLATFALCADPHRLLLGLATHLAFFDLTTHEMCRIVDVDSERETRLNDGRCDRQGRFVFGTKHEGAKLSPIGGFYRLNHDLSLEKLPLPEPAISNSIGFSPDGATMYFCDTPTREILACDYGADGSIGNIRVFTRLLDADGGPDGSTVDAEGGLWNAQWGGSRVVRYGPDGVETERVSVPTSHPSCVALGGPHLATLYITTARSELDPALLAAEAGAGGVFVASSARRGLPEPLFLGR
ncbi:SMP-30/gluconolactonase/LRE family protein [Trinickia dinghuensis]|uniref:SMP-30/gluconolactonase/LRE family protein n=1 Tax=Trinickia dinghuensis TaxID=2291023 RepID=A0A3D8JNP8_9BURK|nr:SMP-30/gluconolactonase/LRE family protein [Trinickia dinghuensis]RDU94647.1 SMP-30/gluconolactonase/LRE family protein [Trinickia dinghuensis]